LNRIDEIIVFRQLTKEEVGQIAEMMLKEVYDRLAQQQQIQLQVTDRFKRKIIEEGYSATYGARPLRRAIMKWLEDPLAEHVLANTLSPGMTAVVDLDGEDVKVLPSKQMETQIA
jgi:ATP-dependent Clp protease ATP-binding subunit ClpC